MTTAPISWLLSSPFRRWLGFFALVLVGLFLVAQVPGLRLKDWHLRYLASQLDSVQTEELEDHFAQIARYEQDGLPFVVDAMAHQRSEVVVEAEFALQAEVERWKTEPIADSVKKVERLMFELQRVHSTLSPSSMMFASRLAVESLAWPISPNNRRARKIAEYASTVIEATPTLTRSTDRARTDTRQPSYTLPAANVGIPGGDLPFTPENNPDSDPTEAQTPAPIPPGTLPPGTIPPGPASGAASPAAPSASILPAPTAMGTTPLEQTTTQKPGPTSSLPAAVPSPQLLQIPAEQQRIGVAPSERSSGRVSGTKTNRPFAKEVQLATHLVSTKGQVTNETLLQAGFSVLDVRLANLLASASDDQLREVLEGLPSTRGVRSDIWLVWFSNHRDGRIRKLTASIMASSQNPRLLQYIKHWQSWETDARVVQHLKTLIEIRE